METYLVLFTPFPQHILFALFLHPEPTRRGHVSTAILTPLSDLSPPPQPASSYPPEIRGPTTRFQGRGPLHLWSLLLGFFRPQWMEVRWEPLSRAQQQREAGERLGQTPPKSSRLVSERLEGPWPLFFFGALHFALL